MIISHIIFFYYIYYIFVYIVLFLSYRFVAISDMYEPTDDGSDSQVGAHVLILLNPSDGTKCLSEADVWAFLLSCRFSHHGPTMPLLTLRRPATTSRTSTSAWLAATSTSRTWSANRTTCSGRKSSEGGRRDGWKEKAVVKDSYEWDTFEGLGFD